MSDATNTISTPATCLADRKCVACSQGTLPLQGLEILKLLSQTPDWTVIDEHHITRTFHFPDFVKALAFVNRVGALAEEQGHHPLIRFTWGKVAIELWTHKVGGLSENDFILAARIDRLPTD